jgi:protein tyrosine phosphatase (PTP) superfamily phosphohydrolase (DUF442 family)
MDAMTERLADIYNYRAVEPGLATSGQPDEEDLAAIAAAGYEAVVNLALHDDPRYSLADEAGTVRSLNLKYEHIPVIFTEPTYENLNAFFAAMALYRSKRRWVHCAANKRASTFIGLYLHIVEGHSIESAFATERSVWEPNPVWAAFKVRMLATYPPPRARE